ncbi:hypothetical protein PVT68_12860 [Microbulbifer bruguierae]|uniref:DUF2939 domain-containing protein n=1 Tax=Microbulbifer bruguierae TaxID=3029061 RepID=A0ABY8NAP3_9GAMM|nr:hypothetical protein [Microbulbifer bruguierae]WGL15657.1 hypothetical protein PVT68_12860 [Microbulbifer bruguierae]
MKKLFTSLSDLLSNLPQWLRSLSHTQQRQLLAATIWVSLAGFCLATLGHAYGQQKQAAQLRDRASAQAAAKLLASQSLEQIVAGDRISLQMLAQQTLALPAVYGVTIQDVDSSPLAQAGERERGEMITEPVVLHDSLAGSVALNIQPGAVVGYPWASLLLCLIFALPFSAACALTAFQLPSSQPQKRTPLIVPKAQPKPPPEVTAGLYLRPLNWAQLGNQLSRSALENLQTELDKRMQLLTRIYDARPLPSAGPAVGLGFAGEDAAFRAVCAGLLLRGLQQSSRATGLQLALAVLPTRPDKFDFSGEQLLSQSRGLTLHPQLQDDESLENRIQCHTTSWGAEVTGLNPKLQQLLDNQLQQLVSA